MKQYPSIPKIIRYDLPIVSYEKFDGSLIRSDWSHKRKFYKFGTRTELIDDSSHLFSKAIPIIKEKYEESLSEIFKYKRYQEVTCFFEFYGPNSAFGQHDPKDNHTVTLIDASPYKIGFLKPNDFIEMFKDVETPKVIYEGYITDSFVQDIKSNKFNLVEGVVCKGFDEQSNKIIMFKIKAQEWLDKLKTKCNGNVLMFEKLS